LQLPRGPGLRNCEILYGTSRFAALLEEYLEAPLLGVRFARQGVEAIEGSALKHALEPPFPGLSRPPQRRKRRTLLLEGLVRIEEFFGRRVRSPSQLYRGYRSADARSCRSRCRKPWWDLRRLPEPTSPGSTSSRDGYSPNARPHQTCSYLVFILPSQAYHNLCKICTITVICAIFFRIFE
jgi:hypothetical protein